VCVIAVQYDNTDLAREESDGALDAQAQQQA